MINITINTPASQPLLSTPVNSGAKGYYSLMQHDYITLPFSLQSPVEFGIGSYADLREAFSDALGGKLAKIYKVCDLQTPTYNTSTGGYDYELRLDAYYWLWKNKIFKYTPEAAGQEASWSLTASLDVHLGVFLRNLDALGETYGGKEYEFSIDSTVENKAVAITYDNTNLIDALSRMAEAWGCEWWVTENVIHFGRLENGDAVELEIGVQAEDMTRNESKGTYATRIYAFGSTRNIPENYRPNDNEDLTVNGVVQKRLMLPDGTPYIDARPGLTGQEVVESVVVFDDIYPRRVGTLSDVKTVDRAIEDEEGNQTGTFKAYQYKDTGLTFSPDYVLEGQELRIVFQSGKMNGLDFGVTFNPDNADPAEQLWEIVANEDYGRRLPDEVIKPENGDTYILYGFDIKLVSDQYIPAAEQELKDKAEEYVAKTQVDDGTYTVPLYSTWVEEDEINRTFDTGQKIKLVNPAFFGTEGRVSRVIGWEMCLDIPHDRPVYTVGESAQYSRLGELEDKVDAITYGGQTYVGGGGGVYLIKTNDSTPASDSNVYSALRSLAMFLRKDKQDEARFLIKFLGGLEVGEYAEGLSGASIREHAETLEDGSEVKRTDMEVDRVTARLLAKVKELLVADNAQFNGNLTSEDFVSGFLTGKGWSIFLKEVLNAAGQTEVKSVAEFDEVIVRGALRVYEFIVSQMLGENDNRTFTGMMEVDHYDPQTGRVWLDTQEGRLYNPFRKDDIIIVQQYNGLPSEENNYYVIKNYELLVTDVGTGNEADGENRLDWVEFTNFSGGDPSELITKGDTFVRIDNLTDPARKGIIQVMTVGNATPYIDIAYGLKTDPDNALKGRLGNLQGIYHHLFGWLQGFGQYLINLYAVGDFRLRQTGESLDAKVEMNKSAFQTAYKQLRYDLTEEDNYLHNADFTEDMEGWTRPDVDTILTANGQPLVMNRSTVARRTSYARLEERDGRQTLHLSDSQVSQANALVRKPGKHKEYVPADPDSGDPEQAGQYVEVDDTLYLSLRCQCRRSGTLSIGFQGGGGSLPHVSMELTASEEWQTFQWQGTWDGVGDFVLVFEDGDLYVSLLSVTDRPLDAYKLELSTSIAQTASYIQLSGRRYDAQQGSLTQLGIRLDAAEEDISLTAERMDTMQSSFAQLSVNVSGISSAVAGLEGDFSDLSSASDEVKQLAQAAQNAANVAGQNALSALSDAAEADAAAAAAQSAANAAQSTANTANSKATANATAIQQTKDYISLISGNFDSAGHFINAAGFVTTAAGNSLWASKTLEDGSTIVSKINQTASGVKIQAAHVDLQGAVTFTMLGADAQDKINAAQSSANAAQSTADTANSRAQTAQSSVDSLEGSLGDLAYENKVEAAKLGSTIIQGGYLNTEYIKVNHLDAATGTFSEIENEDGSIRFGPATVAFESQDIMHQGVKDGRPLRFYTNSVWCRSSFGAHMRLTARVVGKTIYYYPNGTDKSSVSLTMTSATDPNKNTYYIVPCYGQSGTGVEGMPVDTVVFCNSTRYNYLLQMAYTQRVCAFNAYDDYSGTYFYLNGVLTLLDGGKGITVQHIPPSWMLPSLASNVLGRGLMICGEKDVNW